MKIASERVKLVFQKMERNLRRLASEQQADDVHNFRTTARRLETVFELLPTGDRNQKKLLEMLTRMRRRAGRVRDIDVQLAALRSLKFPQQPRRKTELTQKLLELRVKHEKALGKLLKPSNIRELRKRLRRAAKHMELKSARDPLAVAKGTLDSVTAPGNAINEELLHRYRIAVKRARYAAEFAPRSREAAQFIAQLEKLQDRLGNWHDWLTLTKTAADRFGEIHQSPLVAALHNVTQGKFRGAVSAISAANHLSATPASANGEKVAAKTAQPSERAGRAA